MANADHRPDGRTCTKCGEFKLFELFGNAPRGQWGKSARCKECDHIYYQSRRDSVIARSKARKLIIAEQRRQQRIQEKRQRLSNPMKVCGKCRMEKEKSEFTSDKRTPDGLKSRCKECRRIEFAETIARRGRNHKSDTWHLRNPEKRKAITDRHRTAIHNRLHHTISARIYSCLKGKGGRRTKDLLGYEIQELIKHIERQFSDGMSWDNYGAWHIDHVIPISSFKIKSIEDPELQRAWGLPNLRPLWAEDNHRKNGKRTHLL